MIPSIPLYNSTDTTRRRASMRRNRPRDPEWRARNVEGESKASGMWSSMVRWSSAMSRNDTSAKAFIL